MSENNQYIGKRTILIVEDNEINREILSSILEDEYNVITAENGKIGYDLLSKEYKNLSLILLDVYMPVMNGFEFLDKIKGDALLSSIPVIVTTGSDKPEDEVKCLQLGASDFVTKPYNPEVVIARVHSIIKLKESINTLSIVEYDELTGLYTLPAFYHHAEEIIKNNPDKQFDLALANVKDFKLINSIFGEQKGNELLQYIANNYKEQMPFAIIARSGDKFYSLYESGVRFNKTKGKNYYDDLINNAPFKFEIKYGMYSNVDKSLSIHAICDRAMLAAQSIKDDFTKVMNIYDDSISNKLIYNQNLEQKFDDAIKNKEFIAYYQPKVDPNTGKIVAAEALVRWFDKENNKMISPGAFIPLFESDGLITKLDEYMFKTVCNYQKLRIKNNKKVVPISINLSRNSIYTKDVSKIYLKMVNNAKIPMDLVPLEITESATTQKDTVLVLANSLTKTGFSLHMDDFGTGYSSLSSLVDLPFDVIKLDKSLIDKIGNDKGEIIITHMIKIAQDMGMQVVAEGVEKQYQVDFLKENGCDMIQGYFYSAPKDEHTFSSMLDSNTEEDVDIKKAYNEINLKTGFEFEVDEAFLKTMRKIADDMMEGFLVYKATLDETIIYANPKLISMFKCDSLDDFRLYTNNSFKGIVDKDEYEEVEKSIFNQVNENEKNNDAVEYHIKRKDGTKIFVLDQGHCVYSKPYGNIFYVFIRER